MTHRAQARCAVVLVGLLITGCADSTDTTTTTTTTALQRDVAVTESPDPVGGLVAELGTNRLYVVDRAFGLALRNVGDEPVVVSGVQLQSDEFEALPMSDRQVTLPPGGRRLVVPLPYGEARCAQEAGASFGVVVVLADGQKLRLDAAEEYDGAIGRLHHRECAAADVLDRVDITFGDDWTQEGTTVSGVLRMAQRHPGEPVAVDDAVGNVIFTLVVDRAHPVLRVTDDAPSATVPVTISADRCDPHAVAEFKRPYVFLSWVAVGDRAPVPVELELTGGARAALDTLIATCST